MKLWLIQFHDSENQAIVQAEDENGIREVVVNETSQNFHIIKSLTDDDGGSGVFYLNEDLGV